MPVLRDGFNTFPSSPIQRTSIIISGNSIESGNTPFSNIVTLGTSKDGLPGSVIVPVPGFSTSGRSLFGTLPLPSSSGTSTLVPGAYIEPSCVFGVAVSSPVLGSCSNSTFASFDFPSVRTVIGVTLPVFGSTS